MDPLLEVLRSVRLTGGVFLDARLTAPWCVTSQLTVEDCRPYLAEPAQLIAYHVVIEGRLLLLVEGGPPVMVEAGEIILLPRNGEHMLASAEGLMPVDGHSLVQLPKAGGLARIRHGGGGPGTHFVCGFLGSDEAFNPLIAGLPPALKVDVREAASRSWIEASVRFAAAELVEGRLASSELLSRLSELLLVEAVRRYAGTLGEDEAGWLKALKDPQIGRALALIHQDVSAAWTAEALAQAMSRSAFVERFSGLVGMPPIRYLTFCRLQAAKRELEASGKTVAQLAHAVGYESEEAFSRAFKRAFGLSPVRWKAQAAGLPGGRS